MSLAKQLITKGIRTIIIRVVGTGVAFLLSVYLARKMGAENFGLYSFTLSLLIFFAIPLQAGLPNLMVRETAKSLLIHDWASIRGLSIWCFSVILLYTLFLGLLLGMMWLFNLGFLTKEREIVFFSGLILIPISPLLLLLGAYLRGIGNVVAGIIPDALVRPGFALFFIWLLGFIVENDLEPDVAMTSYVVANCIAIVMSFIVIWFYIPKDSKNLMPISFKSPVWRKAVYPLTIVGGLQLLYSYIDILILGFYHSNEEVGVYRAVGQLGTLVVFGLTAINQMLHSYFAKLYTEQEFEKLQQLVAKSSLAILAVAMVPAIIFIFAGKFVLGAFFGDAFSVGAVSLLILTIGQLANALFGSVGALLNMTGHERDAMNGMLYSLMLNVVLSFLLIPAFGMEGAAMATAISLFAWNFILRLFVKRRLQIETIGLLVLLRKEVHP